MKKLASILLVFVFFSSLILTDFSLAQYPLLNQEDSASQVPEDIVEPAAVLSIEESFGESRIRQITYTNSSAAANENSSENPSAAKPLNDAQSKFNNLSSDGKDNLNYMLSEFEKDIIRIKREWGIPGMSVAAVIDGKIVYRKSFGVKDTVLKEPVDNQTIFQIGSCTKAFTSMLAAIFDDRGILSFDDKVIKHLPEFRFSNPILTQEMTLEDLLSQYSGLTPYSQHFMLLFGYTRRQIINSIRYIRMDGNFRQTYGYQNNLFLLAGEIMREASGIAWEQNLNKYILTPLKMQSTTSDLASFINAKNRSYGHYYRNGSLVPASDKLPYNSWPYIFAPAGGINTNIDDFSKWLLFLTNDGIVNGKRLVSKKNMDRVFSKKVQNKQQGYYYCLGWRLSPRDYGDNFWHGGTTDMQGAYISFLRGKNIGAVILMNLNNVPAAESITLSLYDLYFQKDRTDWSRKNLQRSEARRKSRENASKKVEKIIPPQNLKNYTGKYINSLYGIVEVRLENNQLKFSAGSFKTWLTLTHYNKDSFSAMSIPGWSFKKPEFRFRVDKKSAVTGLFISDMSDGVDSLFKKISG
ncbi:MAG: serine hydrolase [Elusimicrobiota bacterium]|jgi:CubicO group peptidase (beta-lactamase class C family)|nr:serine hydrolase [Elusimicrobiota bacterium]